MSQPISEISYTLSLLINLENEKQGGTFLVDSYTFDPNLSKGDVVQIQEWKVGVKTEHGIENLNLSFDARVMEIEKVVVRHQRLVVNIILESPNREAISQLREAMRDRNPEQFSKGV